MPSSLHQDSVPFSLTQYRPVNSNDMQHINLKQWQWRIPDNHQGWVQRVVGKLHREITIRLQWVNVMICNILDNRHATLAFKNPVSETERSLVLS